MSAIEASVGWVQSLLFGPVATSLMVLAVASVGLRALAGYGSLRYAALVVTGCFILVGAPQLSDLLLPAASSPSGRIIVYDSKMAEMPARRLVSEEARDQDRSDNPFAPYEN